MNKRLISILPIILILGSVVLFFYPVFLKGYIPFPGDLLVAEFKPWRTYSYRGYVPGSVPNKAQYPDTIRQLYPWKTLVVDSLKKSKLPLWNPYNFSGAPLFANFQSAALYPLNFFYLVVSMPIAWTILIILQPLLALIFTYTYARKIRLGAFGSLFAGVTYAFSSFMTVWLEYNSVGHVILWLPLVLLAIEHLNEKFSVLWSSVFIFALLAGLLAGHPQIFAYLFVLTIIYSLCRIDSRIKKLYVGGLSALALGLGAAQIVPGMELVASSARSPHPFDTIFQKILIQPWQLLMAVVPDFFGNPATRNYWPADTYIGKVTYIGVAPFLFVLSALRRWKRFYVKFFTIAAIAAIVLVTANPFTYLLYKLPIPLLSTSAPTLMVFIFCFSGAMLAGIGMDAWIKDEHSKQKLVRRLIQAALALAILWVGIYIFPRLIHTDWSSHLATAKRPLLYTTLVISLLFIPFSAAVLKPKYMRFFLFVLICFHIADLFFSFRKFTPFAPVDFVYPKTDVFTFLQEKGGIGRFWGHSSAHIEANVNAVDGLYSPEGYDPLYPRWYGEFIQSSRDGAIHTTFTDQTRSDAAIAPSTGNDDIGLNTSRLRVLDALGVAYVLDRDENAGTQVGFPTNRYQLAYQQDAWKIYTNLKAAPRFMLTSDYVLYDSPETFSKLFFSRSFDPSRTVLLKEDPGFPSAPKDEDTSAILQSYSPSEVTIVAQTKQTGLLFLSDTYYPGWKAFIDGAPTKIFQANYAFRAVVVPSGSHVIRFVYLPQSLEIGAAISGASLLAIMTLLLIMKLRYHEKT